MGATWVRAVLFIVGGLVAAAGTAYFTGMFQPPARDSAPVAASTPSAEQSQDIGQEAEPQADSAAAPADGETLEEQAAEAPGEDELIVPAFDLLRVEPDGSIVIAGRAAPAASIELLEGDEVLATTTSETNGEFVSVLDEPLEPGEYQLVLRSTTNDNVVVTSTQTALVSIPEQADGEVLALVDEPGQPSELISVPSADGSAAEAAMQADEEQEIAPPAGGEQAETSSDTSQAGGVAEPAATSASEPAPIVADDGAAPADTATSDGEASPAIAGDDATADRTTETVEAAEPADGETEVAVSDEAAREAEEGGAGAEAEVEIAAVPTDQSATEAPSPAAGIPAVMVEAVEIEGDMVFVAGRATAGYVVRGYANSILLGDSPTVQANGTFLIEARRELPVGDYIIRADLIGRDGSVAARAAVPFQREEGEAIAAIAPGLAAGTAPSAEPQAPMPQTADLPSDGETPSEVQTEAATSSGDGAGERETAGTSMPAVTEDAAVQDEVAAQDRSDADVQGSGNAPATSDVSSTSQPASPAADVAEAPPATSEADRSVDPEADTDTARADRLSSEQQVAAEVTAPALERAEGSVIIRRGDTLWRISRRVYGRGVRYTNIYLANQDQIRDPDRIWPGQIFSVPSETAEGEQADLDSLADQLVPAEQSAQ
jgi:nucleoid-associated protein YgaU